MSIFRETLTPEIKAQLELRQNIMEAPTRSAKSLQYMNSRNAWIRMQSAVNVLDSKTNSYTNTLAKNNILQGGVLLNNGTTNLKKLSLRSGVGTEGAYSTRTQEMARTSPKDTFKLGIRPMPGITGLEINSKAAYGSLRDAIVRFQCWDIKQLEELELLYMRPGYTVLVEWGWTPYIDNKSNLITSPPNLYDIINKGETERTTIFKELYTNCMNSNGNYDAMYGYIRNYQWSARPDGGYDCQTTVISTGEIIESLKINYVRPDLKTYNFYTTNATDIGFIKNEFTGQLDPGRKDTLRQAYEKNTMAGMWAEVYLKLLQFNQNKSITLSQASGSVLPFYANTFTYTSQAFTQASAFASQFQIYITLDSVLAFIEKYIIAKGANNTEPLLKLSVKSRTYNGSPERDLYCVAHPLQVSVDPSVCVIKSPLWMNDNNNIVNTVASASGNVINEAKRIANTFNIGISLTSTYKNTITKALSDINGFSGDKIALYKEVDAQLGQLFSGGTKSIEKFINETYGPGIISPADDVKNLDSIKSLLTSIGVTPTITSGVTQIQGTTATQYTPFEKIVITIPSSATFTSAAQIGSALAVLKDFNTIPLDYFYNGDPNTEIGIIKNIYVNLDCLYKEAIDLNNELADKKEKNEINLYRYLKNIISKIQSALGNVSSFEIHVDPVDSVSRIIDLNYTEPGKSKYSSLFQLEVQNTKAVVRSYSLQSQIFPDQSAVIAISSQAKGGQLGMQNNTMIDFNRGLRDRIVPDKNISPAPNLTSSSNTIATSLSGIIAMFGALKTPQTGTTSIDVTTLSNNAKNNLRDLIVYFQNAVDSPGANRNIIPYKFSFDMDGIGGLIIGQLFKLNEEVIPRGYKGVEGLGSQLAQTITRIGHTISNNDWVTKVEALNIVLDNKKSGFKNLDINSIITEALKSINTTPSSGSGNGSGTPPPRGPFGTRCPDVTNRKNYPLVKFPEVAYQKTVINKNDIIAYLKTKLNTYSQNVVRSTYASFGIESGYGSKGINNNINGMQTDGGKWDKQDIYISGVVNFEENTTNRCRSFAVYRTWQDCCDHVLYIMSTRIEGGGRREIVPSPTNPNDTAFWAKGYAKNWIGGGSGAGLEVYWNDAKRVFR